MAWRLQQNLPLLSLSSEASLLLSLSVVTFLISLFIFPFQFQRVSSNRFMSLKQIKIWRIVYIFNCKNYSVLTLTLIEFSDLKIVTFFVLIIQLRGLLDPVSVSDKRYALLHSPRTINNMKFRFHLLKDSYLQFIWGRFIIRICCIDIKNYCFIIGGITHTTLKI